MASWAFLDGIPEGDRTRVLRASTRRRFRRREVLFHEGDLGDAVHLIDRGRVAVRTTTPLGEVVTLNVLGPGRAVGELALLDAGSRRTATVLALEATETLAIDREDFAALRRAHPSVDAFLVNLLALEVHRLNDLLVEALYLPAEARVVRRLLALVALYGRGRPGTEIPLTQEDLASLAGTSRATVNRVLGLCQDAGAVALTRGRVTVVDPEALSRRTG